MNVNATQAICDESVDDPSTGAESAEVIPPVEPASRVEADEGSFAGLVELLLKDPAHVDRLTREPARMPELMPRFLSIVLGSFSLYALALVLVLDHVDAQALPQVLRERWTGGIGSAVSLWLAYALGLVAASGVCLPSFYFFGLLAGVRASMLEVTAHIMKGKASTAIMLMGILPIYFAIVLGMVVFQAPVLILQQTLWVGLVLPFLAGLWGIWAIFRGFMLLADTLPPERRCRRACFLRRLTVSWSAVYTAVTPVMIWGLWNYFVARLG